MIELALIWLAVGFLSACLVIIDEIRTHGFITLKCGVLIITLLPIFGVIPFLLIAIEYLTSNINWDKRFYYKTKS